MIKKIDSIIVEHTFNASIEKVWDSITVLEQMRKWYFENIPCFKAEVGFETRFNVKSQHRNFLHIWKVIKVVPFEKLSYNWTYEDYAGDSFVEFELFKMKKATHLKLTHHILESFPDNIPEFTRASGIEGWTYFIKKRLKNFLETP